jgi:stage V sporulation protein G
MKITDIRILLRDDDKLKAFVSVTFDDAFAVRGMKIIEGAKGMFLAMPSRKTAEDIYVDVAFPINRETRAWLESHVMRAYYLEIEARGAEPPSAARPVPAALRDTAH